MSSVAHGGRLRQAIARYGGSPDDWFDLSTAIAPWPYPLNAPPETVWQRLPEPDDGLEEAIIAYYGAAGLPIPGTQAALQWLPILLPHLRRIVVPHPSYGEYFQVWQAAGRTVVAVPLTETAIDEALTAADALLLGVPNNPTGHTWPLETLMRWHQRLVSQGGLLLVDEAFADAADVDAGRPSPLPAWAAQTPGVIVLRSLGKFFGLAGIRFGVLFAQDEMRARFAAALGPWAVSHPARWAAQLALSDRSWQQKQLAQLVMAFFALVEVLVCTGWLELPQTAASLPWGVAVDPLSTPPWSLTPYAITVPCSDPRAAAKALANARVLVRPFPDWGALRFGLAPVEQLAVLSERLTAARHGFPARRTVFEEVCP